MREIRLGLESGINVSIYAKFTIGSIEMEKERKRLTADVRPSADEYSVEQTRELIRGIEEGIDVGSFADPEIPAERMREIRIKLLSEMNGGTADD